MQGSPATLPLLGKDSRRNGGGHQDTPRGPAFCTVSSWGSLSLNRPGAHFPDLLIRSRKWLGRGTRRGRRWAEVGWHFFQFTSLKYN